MAVFPDMNEDNAHDVVHPASLSSNWKNALVHAGTYLPPTATDAAAAGANLDDIDAIQAVSTRDTSRRFLGPFNERMTHLELSLIIPKAVRATFTAQCVVQVVGIDNNGNIDGPLENADGETDITLTIAATDKFDVNDLSRVVFDPSKHRVDMRGYKYALIVRKTALAASSGLDATERIQFRVI